MTDDIEQLTADLEHLSDRDLKAVLIIVKLLKTDPEARKRSMVELWETVSGEKLDPEARARMEAIEAERRKEKRT